MKQKLRLAAMIGLLLGAVVFWSGQPSRLPEDQVAASKAAVEQWQARQTDDAVHGRLSSAGPAPKLVTHTEASLALVVLGFLLCAVSLVTLIQTCM